MSNKLNKKLITSVIMATSSYKAKIIAFKCEENAVLIYSTKHKQFSSFKAVMAVEALGCTVYCDLQIIDGEEKITARVF